MILSVIVPVYNVHTYLLKCLESLLPVLSFEDEIILVQGRSTDGSRELSIEFQKKYTAIKNIEQDGVGLSNARNCGIQASKGEYILFVDGDDYVDSESFKRLLSKFREKKNEADVIITDYYRDNEDAGSERIAWGINEISYTGRDCLAQIARKHICYWNVWRNIYRKSFLIENGIYFKEKVYAEDIDFTTKVLCAKPRMIVENIPFYHYRVGRAGSLMELSSLDKIITTIGVIKDCIFKFRELGELWSYPFVDGLQFEYILNMALIQEIPFEDRRVAIEQFRDYKNTLSPTKDVLVYLVKKIINIIGISNISELLSIVKKVKRKKEQRSTLKK